MRHLFTVFLAMCLGAVALMAQVKSNPSPIPVGYKGQITLTFDPTKGSGGMKTATECYSHIGLITSQSRDVSDWKYIKVNGGWGTKTEPQWTKVGDNWQLVINNMYTYFGCPETEEITAIVMVFHDGNGGSSKEGKSTTGGDILVGVGEEIVNDIWEDYNPAAVVEQARPSGVVNGIYYGNDGTSVTLCTYAASKTEPAKHVFLIGDMTNWKIDNNYQLKRDGNYFWITLTGLEKGKEYRYQYAVERADGVKKQISDLFSEKVLSPDDNHGPRQNDPDLIAYPKYGADGYVSVLQCGKAAYDWSSATLNFQRPDKNNLVIYEIWVYDHTPKRNFEGLMERLDYLQNLGVNAINLMPVNEFDGNYSWGYCPNHYFALDKTYGTPEQFKAFIDECHKRGIAVILDMVFDFATGANPMNKLYPYTSSDASKTELRLNPWFNVNAPHPDNVFEDWNHGFEPVKDHFIRVLKYWLTEYKIDGYLMHQSHGLCSDQPNTSVDNIKYYYTNGVQAVSSDAYFILEHWGNNMYSERPQLVNAGMMCLENTNAAFQQTATGWLKDGDDLANANKDNYVSISDWCDEERCFFKTKQWGNGNLKEDESARAGRVAMNLGFQSMLNGPQFFYHFAEIGFDYSQYQNADGVWGQDGVDYYGAVTATPSIKEFVQQQAKARPEELGWFKAGPRMKAYQRLGKIIQLRTKLQPKVFDGSPTEFSIASGRTVRTIQWASDVYVVGNFSATDSQSVALPTGTWYDYLDGNNEANSSYTLAPGEIKVFTGTQLSVPEVPDKYSFTDEPLSISEAISIGMELDSMATSVDTFTVEGYVINAGTFNEKYRYQTWYMADDAHELSSVFQAYRCYALDGKDTIAVVNGQKVRMTGQLKKYYDRATKSFIIEMLQIPATIISQLQPDTVTVEQALSIGSDLMPKASTIPYVIRGYVSYVSAPYSSAYENKSFYMTDDISTLAFSNATGGFYVYHGVPQVGALISEGALVEVTTTIYKYQASDGTYTIESGTPNVSVNVLQEAPACRSLAGECGENVTWAFNTCDGHLTISGTGPAAAYPTRPESPFHYLNVQSVTIEEGVSGLGRFFFYGCTMPSVTLPASLDSISVSALNRCPNLKRIEVKQGNTHFASVDGVLFNKDTTTLFRFPTGRDGEYTIPKTVTKIGYGAFNACYDVALVNIPNSVVVLEEAAFFACLSMESIIIPEGVARIGQEAFSESNKLLKITNYAKEPQVIDSLRFVNVNTDTCVLYVPEASLDKYKKAEGWRIFKKILPIAAEQTVVEETEITTTTTTAEVKWPQITGAYTYELVIKDKSGNVICTLVFDAEGHLLSLAFSAPSADDAPQATQSVGFVFTITGLDSSTSYDYLITTKDDGGTVINTESGSFQTEDTPTDIGEIDNKSENVKIIRDGHLYILRDGKEFNVLGQSVR